MGNVLSGEKREQVLALGRLGWPLRRIEEATGVRRETAGDYLRKAGIVIRPPGSWGEKSLAKAATQLITGSDELSVEALFGYTIIDVYPRRSQCRYQNGGIVSQ